MTVANLAIKLVVGLGNPGKEYAMTRHNVGMWFIDAIANKYNVTTNLENKFFGQVGKFKFQNKDIYLLKPETFMNASGKAVLAVANFYKIKPEEILVIHDELDFNPGVIKLKFAGGAGGHNGLRDIDRVLGNTYWRLRLGIGHPGNRNMVHDYVLKKPSLGEESAIHNGIDRGLEIFDSLLVAEFADATKILHTKS